MSKLCRRHNHKLVAVFSSLIPLLIFFAGSQASAQACLPWSSTIVPFDSVYYVSAINANGDRLVVGDMSLDTYRVLRTQIAAPSFVNQQFCGSVKLAAGVYAQAYVPTPAEWSGDFSSSSQGALRDPVTATPPSNGLPFAGGIIPPSRIPQVFAWRINSHTPRLPVTSTAPLHFVPVPPCRIADKREGPGPFGAPQMASMTTRNFEIPSSSCGIPSGTQAYSLNFTVIPQSTLDYITVFPKGRSRPLASLLNSYDGRIKANAAIVPVGDNGGISVFTTDTTNLIIDVAGYFVADSDTTALAFYPLSPCRIVDTREASGTLAASAISAGEERVVPIRSSNCGVPPEAQAYSLNYTVIPNGPLSYLSTWPSGQTRPTVSTLNAQTGSITANSAIVPAGQNGGISVYATSETQLILDINGYFAPPASSGLSLYTVAPCRIYDSRSLPSPTPLVNTEVFKVSNTACGALTLAKSFVLNSTVVPVGSLLYLSLFGDAGQANPNASALNAPDGVITSNLSLVPTTNGSVSAFASDPTHLILDISGYFAP